MKTYCYSHYNTCIGTYAYPDDRAWMAQVVQSRTAWGTDSSSSSLHPATTTYYYHLAKTGTGCPAAGSDTDCVGDNWTPAGDSDWQDFYHAEWRGFNGVFTISPAGDLTAQYYYSTHGWSTPSGYADNYSAGKAYEEDVYSGNSTSGPLLQQTKTFYAGNQDASGKGTTNSCNGNYSGVYNPCLAMAMTSITTDYEGTGTGNSNAPWMRHDYTYDDYAPATGLNYSSTVYHNLLSEQISSSNAPTLTKKWSYTPTDTGSSWTYYDVNKVTSSEVDDASGHVWQCEDTTYDEGAPSGVPSPAAGWATTQKAYSDCTNKSGTAITTYTGYDAFGNAVATVDGVATANKSLYSTAGCTLATAPAIFTASSNWGAGKYTSCTSYDQYNAQPATETNALGQQTSKKYDYTQGALPISVTDSNNQTSTTSYSYDASGNPTVQLMQAPDTTGYTLQSSEVSTCNSTSTLPCFEMDTNSSQYSSAITRTFYDSEGRAVETRSPGPNASYDTISFTIYNDQNHSVFKSVPFEVAHGTGWVDPNGAKDYLGVAPGGTTTFYDALNRAIGLQDPNYGSAQEPGISCSGLSGTWTACTTYGLNTSGVSGDSVTYATTSAVDPDNHLTVSYTDALGRTRYVVRYSGVASNSSSLVANQRTTTQYNVLNKPTQVTMTDLQPQAGQTTTSVTTSTTYDDLGRVLSVTDPDRGKHTYTYDADGHVLTDVSGSRTLGTNYDLLGRPGCLQDGTPVINATGACTSGTHAFSQLSYDTTTLGTQGSTDFPVGELTQSIATTYYPDGSQAVTTEKMQHDARGHTTSAQLQITVPTSWNMTTALPTYQLTQSYNDANQPVTTTTSTNPSGQGYTTTQVYDSTTGATTGLSNNSTATATLATVSYNTRSLPDTITFLSTAGTQLATEQFGYDANQRTNSIVGNWQQAGSGSTSNLLTQTRSFDPAGNVISLSTTQEAVTGVSGSGGSETQNFCYDEQNRLIWAGNSGPQPGAGNGTCGNGTLNNSLAGASYGTSFAYTHLGQLWQGPIANGTTEYQYLYCDSSHPHQLTGVYPTGTTCASLSGQVYTSSYDAWGNVTSRFTSNQTGTLSYDALDHLTEWSAGTPYQEYYIYDASGQRVARKVINGSDIQVITYPFGREEHQYNASGTNQSNTYYLSLNGQMIGKSDGGTTTFFIVDAEGTPLTSFSNQAGSATVNGNQVYSPYGTRRYHQGLLGTSKGFTGQYADWLSGLDYYNARYYDPVVGRFISADTVQGNLQGMDPYAYVAGNPETLTDPTGKYHVCPDNGCLSGGGGGNGEMTGDSHGGGGNGEMGGDSHRGSGNNGNGGDGDSINLPQWHDPSAPPPTQRHLKTEEPHQLSPEMQQQNAKHELTRAVEHFTTLGWEFEGLTAILAAIAIAIGAASAFGFTLAAPVAALLVVISAHLAFVAAAAQILAATATKVATDFGIEESWTLQDWQDRGAITDFYEGPDGPLTIVRTSEWAIKTFTGFIDQYAALKAATGLALPGAVGLFMMEPALKDMDSSLTNTENQQLSDMGFQ